MTLSAQALSEYAVRPGSGFEIAKLVADQIGNEIGATRFETWFGGGQCISVSEDTIVFRGESEFALQRMQTTFSKEISSAVSRVCGPQFSVEFVLDADESGKTNATEVPANQPPEPLKSRSRGRNSGRGLSSFCFGEDNRLAETSSQQVVAKLAQFSPFFVYGPTGSGKTHLLDAITNDVRRRRRGRRCIFLSAEQFTNYFIQALRGSGLPVFRRKYRDLDLLAIDDIHFLAGKKATINEFQFTIDNLSQLGKQIVLSSDRAPVELFSLAPDLIARLTSGLICPLHYPDYDGRLKIVQRICAERSFNIPESLLQLVCERLPNDVRRLSGAINRLHAAAVATGRPVSYESACRILNDLFAVSGVPTTSLHRIEKAVCDFCQIRPSDLKSSSRKKRICTARMLAMYLSREFTSSAFSEIGDYFGGRSHSTVIAARKKVHDWIMSDHQIELPHAAYNAKELVKRIETQLRTG